MKKMILVDLETQNFAVESGIYEVSCLVIDNYKVVDSLYLGNKIEGYKGPTTYGKGFYNISRDSKAIKQFKDFLEKHKLPLVAHNCSFDRKFLLHYNWIDEDYPCYCSITAIKKEVPGLPSYSLANLVNYYNVSTKNNHTATSDTEALLELLKIVNPKSWRKMSKPKAKTEKSSNSGYYVEVDELGIPIVPSGYEPEVIGDYESTYEAKYKAAESIYEKKWFVYLMILLFFPVGLLLLWINDKTSKSTKIIVTIIIFYIGLKNM